MGCCSSTEASESEISDIELNNIQSVRSRTPSITPSRAPSISPPRAPSVSPPRAPSIAPSRAPSWTQEELDLMFAGLGIQIDPNINPEELVHEVPPFRPSFPPTPPRTPTPPPPRNFNTPPRFRNP